MKNQHGYSLLEIMISMVILAIAFLAIIATQIGSLRGYVSARDTVQATEMNRRVAFMLQAQGTQWLDNVDDDSNGGTPDRFNPTALFAGTADDPLDVDDPFRTIRNAPGWVALVDKPVDGRFRRQNVSAALTGGKYCLYARGADLPAAYNDFSTGAPITAATRFQLAVVYPGPTASLDDCAVDGTVTAAMLDDTSTPPLAELSGFRIIRSGTIVVRRAYLTQFAGGSL